MKKRFSEEQIIGILRQHEKGMKVTGINRQHNISEQTFYRWKKMIFLYNCNWVVNYGY